jgi:putative membrane protein
MYLWIKALHVIAVMSWMAGLLYLPRLFVYHAENVADLHQCATFKVMERRLYRYIMTPAMTISWLTGMFLAVDSGFFSAGWFHAKSLLVLAMTAAHVHDGLLLTRFARDANTHSPRFYRIINEVPTLLMIGIVALVIVKPF